MLRHERETCERRIVVRVSLMLLMKHANLKIIRRSSGGNVYIGEGIEIWKSKMRKCS